MKRKYVIITILVIVFIDIILVGPVSMILSRILWPRGEFKISYIENGNTVVLDNGTKVKLIGVYDTPEAKEYLYENYEKVDVALISDSSEPFNPNHLDGSETVWAYVLQRNDNQCLNSTLIRLGLTDLNERSYLSDSLRPYRRYHEVALSSQ